MAIVNKTASFSFDVNGQKVNVNWEEPIKEGYKYYVTIYYNNYTTAWHIKSRPSITACTYLLKQIITK